MIKIAVLIISLISAALGTTIVYHKTQQSDIFYYQGRRLFNEGNFDKALPFFKKSLAINPRNLAALKDTAYSYQWTKRHAEAVSYFRRILLIEPKDLHIKESLALTLAWEKEYTESIAIYEEIIKETNDYDARVQLAEILIWDKQLARAEVILRSAVKERPMDFKPRLLLANILLYSGNTLEASRIYESLLREKNLFVKDSAAEEEIRGSLGQAYMISKDYPKAIAEYEAILNNNPLDVKALVGLADILSWQKDYDEAIKQYTKALYVEPDNLDIKEKVATVYFWKKDYRMSESICKDVLKKDPRRVKVYAMLAQMLSWQKRYEEAFYYFKLALNQQEDRDVSLSYAQALLFSGDYAGAKDILSGMTDNLEAKTYLADAYAYSKDFKRAILLYEDILRQKSSYEIKRKLADLLSWDRQYKRAIKLYDELLQEKEDRAVWRQKARVLGWMKKYNESIKEYQRLCAKINDPVIELEMKAKQAYWDNRITDAIDYYNQLITLEPGNQEAMFDLAQIYSYQSLWGEASGEYERILELTPTHFRASEGLQKSRLISSALSLRSGYEFFEADSSSRVEDIKRYSFINKFVYPLNYNLNFNLDYKLTNRSFSDYGDILENEGRLKLVYLNNPDWWADVYYDITLFNKGLRTMHTFGASHAFRFFDKHASRFSYDRQRLENNSTVVRERYYSDNFKERVDLDINQRTKAGFDCLFAHYSDGNNQVEPGLDLMYYLSLDPKRLTLKYRYFYKNFQDKVSEYWAPKGYSANSLKINWRHFLNKEEIFFGANDLYYDFSYEITADSTGVLCHKFAAEFNWDITKRLNFNIKGSDTESSSNIYNDKNITASLNYYF